jgi:hypothetical protein
MTTERNTSWPAALPASNSGQTPSIPAATIVTFISRPVTAVTAHKEDIMPEPEDTTVEPEDTSEPEVVAHSEDGEEQPGDICGIKNKD